MKIIILAYLCFREKNKEAVNTTKFIEKHKEQNHRDIQIVETVINNLSMNKEEREM